MAADFSQNFPKSEHGVGVLFISYFSEIHYELFSYFRITLVAISTPSTLPLPTEERGLAPKTSVPFFARYIVQICLLLIFYSI